MSTPSLLDALRTGLTPFMGLPSCPDPIAAAGVVLGAPFDGGVIHRPGARLGPWALRSASLGLGSHPMPLRFQGPLAEDGSVSHSVVDGWVDGGNLATRPFSIDEALLAVETGIGAWAAKGTRTLMLGGDHLMTLGALRALAQRHGPLGLLHLDAHPDAGRGDHWGSDLHHGTWVRAAIEEGLIVPDRTVQLGLRAPRFEDGEVAFLQKSGIRMWTPLDLRDPRLGSQLNGDLARVGQGAAYVSVDLDVLDPAFAPAVAEPVPGGLSVMETIPLLRAIHRWSEAWVGADVMELSPTLEGGELTARAAAHLALHLLG